MVLTALPDFCQSEQNSRGMEQQSIRKTYKYKLKPTPEQERTA